MIIDDKNSINEYKALERAMESDMYYVGHWYMELNKCPDELTQKYYDEFVSLYKKVKFFLESNVLQSENRQEFAETMLQYFIVREQIKLCFTYGRGDKVL
jgi:hypothetical protein